MCVCFLDVMTLTTPSHFGSSLNNFACFKGMEFSPNTSSNGPGVAAGIV
jgi:hypothetical protein